MHETSLPGVGPRHGLLSTNTAADDSLLARIIPLWIGKTQDGGVRPSLIFGTGEALISATSANPCDGSWQLHLFSFSYEARQALQTVKLIYPGQPCEAAARPTGEGLLLIRMGDGPFECRIVDRRGAKDGPAPMGSWQCSHAVARQATLHIPRAACGQARKAAKQILSELNDPTEKAELCVLMGCKNRLDDRPLGQIRLEEVVAAANRMLEPAGMELTCSDRRVLSFIDAYVAATSFEITGMVERIAHDLVTEMAEQGGIG